MWEMKTEFNGRVGGTKLNNLVMMKFRLSYNFSWFRSVLESWQTSSKIKSWIENFYSNPRQIFFFECSTVSLNWIKNVSSFQKNITFLCSPSWKHKTCLVQIYGNFRIEEKDLLTFRAFFHRKVKYVGATIMT